MPKPLAVLISDIHFSVPNLELASAALIQAKHEALNLDVPLIIAGDLLDSKAIIRAECANRLIEIFGEPNMVETYILVGNHDLVNEKGTEHSLNFLRSLVEIVDKPLVLEFSSTLIGLVPYHSDSKALSDLLRSHDKEKLEGIMFDGEFPTMLIMHQGVQTAFMGHYVQDKTSLSKETFKNFRVISGHYHRAQNIKCGPPRKGAVGMFSYIGTPYTQSFAEADDGPKGFQVLMTDGTLQFIPTNLRKHVILERTIYNADEPDFDIKSNDILWLKVTGPYSELKKLDKKAIGKALLGHSNFKLDLIPTDSQKVAKNVKNTSDEEIFDTLIDSTGENQTQKTELKTLWREVMDETTEG